MPQRNSVKKYYENGFYHIYNRGVEKRDIFLERNDYLAFLYLLKSSLSPLLCQGLCQGGTLIEVDPFATKTNRPRRINFSGKMNLLAYCLMPNHFHFLVQQNIPTATTEFLRSICTSYSMYFNKKYQRVGSLFEGVFRAIDIDDEGYLLWVSRYIHRNPNNFVSYPYSSYGDYLGRRQTVWLNTKMILDCFSQIGPQKSKNYQNFVEDKANEPIDLEALLLDIEFPDRPAVRVEP